MQAPPLRLGLVSGRTAVERQGPRYALGYIHGLLSWKPR